MIINVTRVTQPQAEPIDPLIAAFNLNLVPSGPKGLKGDTGNRGWSMVPAAVVDGERVAFQVGDWTGGEGTKPAVGQYIGPLGLTPDIASATDFRGLIGPQGVSVTGATVNGSYNLILTLSTGATINAGYVRGAQGLQGPSGTITIGTVTTLPAGETATVENVGSPQAAVLNIAIPQGVIGNQGAGGTIAIGTVTTLPPGSSATVQNVGTPEDAILNIGIPQGAAGAGNFVGPATAVDGNLVVFNGSTGKLGKDGGSPASAVSTAVAGASAKTTPVDADGVSISDSAAGGALKRVLWSSVKATLKTYFDTLYQVANAKLTTLAGQTWAADRYTYYTSASAAAIGTLTTFGRTFIAYADAATAFSNIKQAATTTATGVVKLSTDAEMTTGTSTTVVPTVKQVADKIASSAGGGITFISNLPTLAGSSAVTLTSLPSGYKRFEIELDQVGRSSATGGIIAISYDNGVTWSENSQFHASQGTPPVDFRIQVFCVSETTSKTHFSQQAGATTFNYRTFTNTADSTPFVGGTINAIRVGVSAGTFSAGSGRLYGVK